MLNRFEEVFGRPKNNVILMGDWSENQQMRNHEPTKGKSMRKLFKDRGYELLLVDEFGTSKYHCESGSELSHCKWDERHSKYVHRLLGFKILTNGKKVYDTVIKDMNECGYKVSIINRDLNGSLNIRNKGWCQLHDVDVPTYLDRSKNGGRERKSKKPMDGEIMAEIELPNIENMSSASKKQRKTVKVIKTKK